MEESCRTTKYGRPGPPWRIKLRYNYSIFIIWKAYLIEWFIALNIVGVSIAWLQYTGTWFQKFFKKSSDHCVGCNLLVYVELLCMLLFWCVPSWSITAWSWPTWIQFCCCCFQLIFSSVEESNSAFNVYLVWWGRQHLTCRSFGLIPKYFLACRSSGLLLLLDSF